MGWGLYKIQTKTMAGGASQSTLPFNLGQTFERVFLQVSTMTSAANISIDVSPDAGTSYYQLRHSPNPLTTTVAVPTFIVAATAAANGSIIPLPPGFQYFRVNVDSSPAAAVAFTVVCGN